MASSQKGYHHKLQKQIIAKLNEHWLEYEAAIAIGDEPQHDMLDFLKFVVENIEQKSSGFQNIVRARPENERG